VKAVILFLLREMKKLTLLLIAGLCFSVSVGALTPQEEKEIERAKAFVKSKGLTWGGQGDYGTKGLYTYSAGKYRGKAYFGIGGKVSQQSAPVRKPKERIPGWFKLPVPVAADPGTLVRKKIKSTGRSQNPNLENKQKKTKKPELLPIPAPKLRKKPEFKPSFILPAPSPKLRKKPERSPKERSPETTREIQRRRQPKAVKGLGSEERIGGSRDILKRRLDIAKIIDNTAKRASERMEKYVKEDAFQEAGINDLMLIRDLVQTLNELNKSVNKKYQLINRR
jgi:hypothetical protein